MPITWVPQQGATRRLLTIAIAALLLFATLAFVPGVTHDARAQTAPDAGSCDAEILFILDSSGSMTWNNNEGLNAVEAAIESFVDELAKPVSEGGAPDSGIAALHFSNTAVIKFATYQNVVTMGDELKAYVSPGGDYRTFPHNWTNWEDAFIKANAVSTPDFVFFLTDGQPTIFNGDDSPESSQAKYEEATQKAEPHATSLRNAVPGSDTVKGIGIGEGFATVEGSLSRLERVTDVAVAVPFDQLAEELAAEINTICEPEIDVTKTVTPSDIPEPGGDAEFTVTVTNTSDLTEADVKLTSLTDDIYGDLGDFASCKLNGTGPDIDPLDVWIPFGDSVVCTWTETFLEDPGFEETDTVTTQGEDPLGRDTDVVEDSATVRITDLPSSIRVVKTALDPTSRPEPGGEFTFSVNITNTSEVDTVTIESIEDDPFGSLTSLNPAILDSTCTVPQVLDPGDGYTCTFSVEIFGVGGLYTDTVTAEGTDDDGQPVSDDDDATVEIEDIEPTISVVKSANPTSVVEPGGNVTFTVTVTNDSDEDVTITSLEDSIFGTLDGDEDCEVGTELEPDASCTFAFVGEVTGEGGDVHVNVVTVTAEDDEGTEAEAEDDAEVTIEAAESDLTVTKTADPTFVSISGTVTFTITVRNSGNTPLTDLTLEDVMTYGDSGSTPLPQCETPSVTSLDPGESTTVECTTDLDHAIHGEGVTNTVTATAIDPNEDTVEDTDSVDVPIVLPDSSGLAIEKLVKDVDGNWVDLATYPNETTSASWQITVTNPNTFDVVALSLSDPVAPACETAFAQAIADAGFAVDEDLTLPAGESVTFECDSTIATNDPVENIATVQGTDEFGRSVGPVEDNARIQRIAPSGQIGDTVWSDENENGKIDNGEKGIANAKVRLTYQDGSATVVETTTNSNGLYLFAALPAGTYRVEVIMSSIPKPSNGDLKLTTPGAYTVTLADGQVFLDADFGVASTLPTTGISSDRIALIGLALLLAGGLAVLATRQRREGEIDPGA